MQNIHKKVVFHLKKGALHDRMHIAPGDKIPVSRIEKDLAHAKSSGDVKKERQDQFALNARKFKH